MLDSLSGPGARLAAPAGGGCQLQRDPDGDGGNYYEFQTNPLNTINEVFWDKPPDEGGKGIFGWDLLGIRHAVQVQGTLNCPRIKDEGWTVELALPWESMGKTCPA